MAVTKFIESGTAATQGFEFWGGTGGTVTSDAQAVAGSVRSIKIDTTGSNISSGAFRTGVLADAGRRFNFWMRYTGSPSPALNGSDFISVVNAGGGTIVFQIGLTSTNKLCVMSDNHTILGTGGTTLTTSTDYRISCAYTITSTTVNSITIYLNGVSEIVVTNGTLQFTGGDEFDFVWADNGHAAGANLVMYAAHFYIDDGTSGDCGAGGLRVTAKLPISNGTTNGMTGTGTPSGTGTGNARYVNERPLSTTNFVSVVAAGSAITEEDNIQTASAGDVDLTGATIIDYVGWVYAKALLSETGKIILNNTQTNISLVNANTLFTKIAASSTYPAGTGTDIGVVTATTATTVSLYEAGIILAYTPAVVAATNKGSTLSMLGVG